MKTPTPPDTKHPVGSADSTAGVAPDRAADDDRALQGEGNYTAARRHRDEDAEAVGLSRARR